MSKKINISLKSKGTPSIDLKIGEDVRQIVSPDAPKPIITFVATGEKGEQGIDGTASISNNSITNLQIADGTITSAQIQNYTISTNDIGAQQITSAKLGNNSVTTNKINNDAVTGAKIADDSIGPEHIINGTITKELINDLELSSDKLENGSITTIKVENGAITKEKIAPKTISGAEIMDDVELGGVVRVKYMKVNGGSPGYIYGPDDDILYIQSNKDLILKCDADQTSNPSTSFIKFQNAGGSDLLTVDESGNAVLAGNLTLTGNVIVNGTVDGVNVAEALSVTQAQTTKINYITVTQPVDLDTIESDVATNNSKVGITTSQADAIVANTAKVGITTQQASDITANNAKVGITTQQASDITTNNSKTSFPGFGTTSGTALEGDTALLQLGTTNTTAMRGDRVTITGTQASAITANTAKVGITTSQADAITANTAKPDLTVDGAGTIHANNVPTLNQNTTGNAATATALAAGNQTIDGDVNIGASQAGHDFTLHGATTQYANIVWDASMNFLKVADASKIVFGNGIAATDFDSSIQANGSNLVIYNDTGNVQIGDTVEITGDLTVTGTVDGIDIATDVAANTAKTSFPGFGTTAGTALEGNTTIPTQYTDSDALNAVTTADNFLKNDTADTIEGDLTVDSDFLYIKDQSGSAAASRFTTTTLTANRTLTMPDASGTLALTSNITPTIIGQFSTRVSSYWSGRYYFGHASYGWNYFAWNYATTSKTTMNDQFVHMGMVSPIATDDVKLRATVRNDSNTENVELCLLKGPRPNGSASNITLTELGSVTVTITTQDLHYNADIDVTDANLAVGDLVFLSVRRISSAANATKYIQVSATIYGE